MARKRFFLWRILTSKRLLITLGGLAATFILLNYIVLPVYVDHGNTLLVPKVLGVPVERARAVLDSVGLEAVVAETRPDPKTPLGMVTVQNPQPDAVVKPGRRVYLTVSGGEILVVVPSLRGRSVRDARFALERSGLQLGGVDYSTSDSYPPNTIMQQTIPAGTKTNKGTPVGVIISRGRIEAEVLVPELIGKSVSEAEKQLLVRGLRVGNITYQASYELLPNTVVDQFPRSGENVQPGQAVDLFVVKEGKPEEEIRSPRR